MIGRLALLALATRSVIDGPMHWQDGGANQPIPVDKLVAFVRSDGHRIEWGNEDKVSGKPASVFKLDLETGRYSYTGRNGLHARGPCRALPGAI